MRTITVSLAVLIAVLATCCMSTASVPPMINYQGKLMQPSGVPVPDNTYSMTFAIYSQPTGGTALWSETYSSPGVQVRGGLFSVLLGSATNLPANVFDSPDRWFGVTVGTDPEMTPRQSIAGVAFAVKAASADSAATVPDGAITTNKLAELSVSGGKIVAEAVDGTKIAPNAVATDKIADGSITAGKIAANASLLRYSPATTDEVSGIGAETDSGLRAGLAATVIVPSGGRPLRITAKISCYSDTANNQFWLRIKEGSEVLQAALSHSPRAGENDSITLSAVIPNPTPGSHTYAVTLTRAGGVGGSYTFTSASYAPSYILVELM